MDEATVLIVEDSRTQALRLKNELVSRGFRVNIAGDGVEALSSARSEPPDLILSDVLMPGMDGFTLCREIRTHPELSSIPIVLRTVTFISEEDRRFALRIGANAYIDKEMHPEDLATLLRGLLHRDVRSWDARLDEEEFPQLHTDRLLDRLVNEAARLEQLNEELSAAKQQLQDVIDNSPMLIYAKDRNGRYIFANRHFEQEIGLDPEQMIGFRDEDLFGSDFADSYRGHDLQVYRTGRPISVEETASVGKQVHTYISTKFPLRDPYGSIYATCGISMDITQAKAAQEQLRRAEKMEVVSRLSSGVAHDFNNLLTIIYNYTTLVADRLEGPDDLRSDLDRVLEATDHGRALVRQIMDFGRPETAHKIDIDINEAVRKLSDLLATSIGPSIEIKQTLVPEPLPVRIIPAQLDQILMNLTLNAADAISETGTASGTITIGSEPQQVQFPMVTDHGELSPGGYAVITVNDDGPGMEAHIAARIFEPFFTTKQKGKGTGLGLATVLWLVEKAGGVVTVWSKPGEGTTFKVYLPTTGHDPGTAPTDGDSDGWPTVLVVDDTEAVREFIVRVLAGVGYRVRAASDGVEALNYVDKEPGIALVLTDNSMPRLSGEELVAILREQKPGIAISFISGTSEIEGEDFLPKPFTASDLIEHVDRLIGPPNDPETQRH